MTAPESRSGLEPWKNAELPEPPRPKGLQWLGVVGPGVIVLGASIGSGEYLLGPAAFVRYGLTMLWVVGVAVLLQTNFNAELMRYTMATGEPAITGFMRTGRRSTVWAVVYTLLYFLQVGWPAWAGTAAGAFFFLATKRVAGPDDASAVYLIGVATFLVCVLILLVGRRIERTLEILNWILVVAIIGSFLVLAAIFVAPSTWIAALAGFIGLSPSTGRFTFLPEGADYVLIGAFAGYCGAGGVINITLSNWARDKGYGMGGVAGYIPAAVGGKKVHLAHSGFTFTPDESNMARWRGWWRIVRMDQWVIYLVGAILGMVLPAVLYVTFLESGQDIRGYGIAAELAFAMEERVALAGGMVAFLGAWVLFKTQLDVMEGMVRGVTDIIWTGSARVRSWRGGDVRAIYYTLLGVAVVWGMIALRLVQPILLLQIGANVAGVTFVIAGLHLLYVNTRMLPEAVRPGFWPRAGLVALVMFYGLFSFLSIRTILA
ncbi:MAG TPA: Nramp family divalent metal transporter [Gemmatimonadaceae bacterium]